jgi:hypothetical protein
VIVIGDQTLHTLSGVLSLLIMIAVPFPELINGKQLVTEPAFRHWYKLREIGDRPSNTVITFYDKWVPVLWEFQRLSLIKTSPDTRFMPEYCWIS